MAILQTHSFEKLSASIIIPTYKRPFLALSLARQIRQIEPHIQIIIVNQEGKDETDEAKQLNVDYINLDTANTSNAKNKAIEQAKGEIVIFFDDDVEITQDTISSHLNTYKDSSIVGVAGRVINDNEPLPQSTEVFTGKTNILGTKFIWQYWSTKKQYVDFAYGCNMSFRRSILEKIGKFDTKFSKIFEEIDLGIRISRKYGKILFLPEALVYHHKAKSGGTRTSESEKKKMIYSHYGYYLAKNIPFPLSIFSLILRTKSALLESPWAIKDLYQSYIQYFR